MLLKLLHFHARLPEGSVSDGAQEMTLANGTAARAALVCAAAAAGSAASVAWLPLPFVWVFLSWAAAAGIAASATPRAGWRALWFNVAAVAVAFAGFEAWLWIQDARADGTRTEGTITSGYFQSDNLLGYVPAKGVTVTARKYHGSVRLYDAVYTIGADGLRIPPISGVEPRGCVLFFGDSVTFGEGVNDTETMPYQAGLKTGGRFRVHNFGFHGYGPHQMLAALEGGRVAGIIRCVPTHVIYQAIVPHVQRVSGLTTWDRHGPRYMPSADGGVVLAGHFDDPDAQPPLSRWLGEALIFQTLVGRRRPVRPEDIELYARIVAQARSRI